MGGGERAGKGERTSTTGTPRLSRMGLNLKFNDADESFLENELTSKFAPFRGKYTPRWPTNLG